MSTTDPFFNLPLGGDLDSEAKITRKKQKNTNWKRVQFNVIHEKQEETLHTQICIYIIIGKTLGSNESPAVKTAALITYITSAHASVCNNKVSNCTYFCRDYFKIIRWRD